MVRHPLPIDISSALIYHRFFILGMGTYLPRLWDEKWKILHGPSGQDILRLDEGCMESPAETQGRP